ncbi:fimbria/pilus outer membrane usher protein [Dyella kyungheensis]|uniref:fimbria/pilus outer membrane usher protein n=1 Tax=Dyella kyungheensis TaxID=1242174 RepID=UPI003CF3ED99
MPTRRSDMEVAHSHDGTNLQRKQLAILVAVSLGLIPSLGWSAAADPAAGPAAIDPAAGAIEFNNAFTAGSKSVDVSRFERGNPILPGVYRLDLYVNDIRMAVEDIKFVAVEGSDVARPCFTYDTLLHMGVDGSKLDQAVVNPGNACIDIGSVSADARAAADMGALRLDVSLPQASMNRRARGYVNPKMWDEGETAFVASYNFNAYSSNTSYANSRANGAGTALGADGSLVTVQNANTYALDPDGAYRPNANGNYMLSTGGSYVPVNKDSFSARSGNRSSSDINAYLGLNLGLNVGGWRLRSQESVTWDQSTGRTRYNNVNTTASHDIDLWKAQLTLGDSYTQGVIFDSTSFRGLTIYSDDRMLPDSQQGYAPTVRGVANTQARVEVRQNGNLLYETTVAPGPFVINDLYATGYGGDITVIVNEADGSIHTFVVPFAAVPMLLRPGIGRWAVTNGQVRNDSLVNGKPYFVEGTYQRGINNWLTLYGGLQSTYRALYKSYLVGAAVNTQAGAFGVDITNSHTSFAGANQNLSGYSARLSYAKNVPTYGTTFAVAAYRYSNANYLSLQDAVQGQDTLTSYRSSDINVGAPYRNKQRLQVTLSQDFGGSRGSMYLAGSRATYWNDANSATTYQVGYSNSWRDINYSLSGSRTYSSSSIYAGSRYDNQFGISVIIPLGAPGRNRPSLMLSTTHDDYSGNNDRASVSGSFGDRSQYNYNASASYSDQFASQTTTSASLGWQAAYGSLSANYSYANRYQQAGVSASGGVVVHPGGVTLAPSLSPDSPIAIIEAPDAKGAAISSNGQSKIDGRGYAVATGLMPYRMNDVTLDPLGTSMDVELQTTRVQTAPRAGSVIPLKFDTVSGRAVLVHATQENGQMLPFGADVLNADGQSVGTVGQGGQLFVRGAEDGGTLLVRWGDDERTQQCKVSYQLPDRVKGQDALTTVDAQCH